MQYKVSLCRENNLCQMLNRLTDIYTLPYAIQGDSTNYLNKLIIWHALKYWISEIINNIKIHSFLNIIIINISNTIVF